MFFNCSPSAHSNLVSAAFTVSTTPKVTQKPAELFKAPPKPTQFRYAPVDTTKGLMGDSVLIAFRGQQIVPKGDVVSYDPVSQTRMPQQSIKVKYISHQGKVTVIPAGPIAQFFSKK